MLKRTHITFGTASGLAFLDYLAIPQHDLPLFFGGLVLGSLINDIDTPNSTIGRKVPILSHILRLLFGHRNFFHSLLFFGFLFSITKAFLPYPIHIGITIGSASHLIGDMMTPRGIQLFYPLFHKNIRFPLTFSTGGFFEYLLMLVFSGYIVYKGYNYFASVV